jgi:hypothetical protein
MPVDERGDIVVRIKNFDNQVPGTSARRIVRYRDVQDSMRICGDNGTSFLRLGARERRQ